MANADVYRLYDNDGYLVYVGISQDTRLRFAQHRRSGRFWNRVTYATVMSYDSRWIAEAVEAYVIANEGPIFNVDPGSIEARANAMSDKNPRTWGHELAYVEFPITTSREGQRAYQIDQAGVLAL